MFVALGLLGNHLGFSPQCGVPLKKRFADEVQGPIGPELSTFLFSTISPIIISRRIDDGAFNLLSLFSKPEVDVFFARFFPGLEVSHMGHESRLFPVDRLSQSGKSFLIRRVIGHIPNYHEGNFFFVRLGSKDFDRS